MKKNFVFILLGLMSTTAMISCSKDDPTTITIDSSQPQGAFTASASGTFVDQNAAGSVGKVELGMDAEGTQFLKFDSDFSTGLATGTVTVYFSTSMDYVADPGNGNPDLRLLGPVQKTGEMYIKVDPVLQAQFTHVILWCATANIPFGYAELN